MCIHTHTHTHTHTRTQLPEHNSLLHVEWKLQLGQFPIKISLQLFFRIDKYTASCAPRQYLKFLFLRSCFHSFCHAWGYKTEQLLCPVPTLKTLRRNVAIGDIENINSWHRKVTNQSEWIQVKVNPLWVHADWNLVPNKWIPNSTKEIQAVFLN